MAPKIIFLDFDGVILNSNGVKDDAFRKIFSEYPDHLEEMMQYHLEHNAIPRASKFKYIGEHFLSLVDPVLADFVQKKSQIFTELTRRSLLECEECVGAREFLEHFHPKVPLVLISATPVAELERILNARNFRIYFSEIYGAPIVKADVIGAVLLERGVERGDALFIGDSPEDLVAAQQSGVSFVGIVGRTDFAMAKIPVFTNLRELREDYLLDQT